MAYIDKARNIVIFLIAFILISLSADCYYYNKVVQKDGKGQISYCDFRVFWFAGYNLRHHIIKFHDGPKGYATFRPLWFIDPRLPKENIGSSAQDRYPVYDKNEEFYHFRYSPFVAFALIPFGKFHCPADGLIVWYLILNAAFLTALLLMIRRLEADFGARSAGYKYLVLWAAFAATLRFYLTNIHLGQTDILVALLFVLFCWSYVEKKDILGGAIFAIILQFKLFFLPMLIYFLLIRRIKIVLATLAALVCFLFIPSYMIGFKKAFELIHDWIGILGASIPSQLSNIKNQSLVYTLAVLVLKSSSKKIFYIIGALGTLSIYIWLVWIGRGMRRLNIKNYSYMEVSILIITSLLFSPITWQSHFIVLLTPICVALYFALNSRDKKAALILLAAFFILSSIVGTDLTKFLPRVNQFTIPTMPIALLLLAFGIVHAYRENIK